jgi:hypothetical protein
VTLRVQQPAKMVRAATRLHRHDASWQFCSQLDHTASLQASSQKNAASAVQTDQTAALLTKIDTKHCDLHE